MLMSFCLAASVAAAFAQTATLRVPVAAAETPEAYMEKLRDAAEAARAADPNAVVGAGAGATDDFAKTLIGFGESEEIDIWTVDCPTPERVKMLRGLFDGAGGRAVRLADASGKPLDAEAKSAPSRLVGVPASSVLCAGSGRAYILGVDGGIRWQRPGCGNIHCVQARDGFVYYSNGSLYRCRLPDTKAELVYRPAVRKGAGVLGFEITPAGTAVMAVNSMDEIVELDLATKRELVRFKVDPRNAKGETPGAHGHLRLVHKTPKGTYLVCCAGASCVREYDRAGKLVWEQPVPVMAFDCRRRANGNTLVSHITGVTEYTPDHKEVWSFKPDALPELMVGVLCGIQELENGNLVVGTWANGERDASRATAFEITRERKLVWAWYPNRDVNMMTAVRLPKATPVYAPENAPREDRFANPPASARILPLHHGRPNDLRKADAELAALKNEGFGGFGGNVNFQDYLDDPASWKTYKYAVEKAHAQGMSLWLYDEKGYPSCSAGGKTLQGHPEWKARAFLVAVTNVPAGSAALPPSPPGRPVATLRRPSADGKTETVYVVTDDFIREGTHVSVSVDRYKNDYPNILMAEPTARFIELTHEAYRRELGDALKYVTSTFTDEPSLMTLWMKPMPYFCLPVSDEFLDAYARKAGHALADDVPELVGTVSGRTPADLASVRHRFWSMVGDRVAANYTGQLTKWADANGLESGGHLLCEEGLVGHVPLYGDFFKVLRGLSSPGCDILTSIPSQVPWITPLLVGSAGDLNGAGHVMSEASDHSQKYRPKGDTRPVYQVSVRELVGSLNRQIWGGVDTFTSYYRWTPFTVDEKRAINEEIGRAVTLMHEGRSAADIALLYPADALMAGFEPQLRWGGGAGARRVAGFVNSAGAALFKAGRSFMFVDAGTLASAKVEDGVLVATPARAPNGPKLRWRTVVLPAATTLPVEAVRRLAAFRRAGGLVIALGDRPVNSRTAFPDAEVAELTKDWLLLPDAQSALLADFLAVRHAPALRRVRGDAGALRVAHRRTARGDVFFVLNDTESPWSGAVALACDVPVRVWDPRTGSVRPAGGEVALDLPGYAGVLLTTEVPVDGALASVDAAAFVPRLAAIAEPVQSIHLGKGQFVKGGSKPLADGWDRVDVELTRSNVDTFAFLSRVYAKSPFSAASKGVGFHVRVPETTGGNTQSGVFLVTRDGSQWYAQGHVPLSKKGEAEVVCAFGEFALHGKPRGGPAKTFRPEDVVRVNFGFGGYFGQEGEKVSFMVSRPMSLEL